MNLALEALRVIDVTLHHCGPFRNPTPADLSAEVPRSWLVEIGVVEPVGAAGPP